MNLTNGSVVDIDRSVRIGIICFTEENAFGFTRIERKFVGLEPRGDVDKLSVERLSERLKRGIGVNNSVNWS